MTHEAHPLRQLGISAQTRRRFLQSAGVGAAGLLLAERVFRASATAADGARPDGPLPLHLTGDLGPFDESGQAVRSLTTAAASVSAAAFRFPVRWSAVEAAPGRYDFSSLAGTHQALVWSGMKGRPVLLDAPAWLGDDETERTPSGLRAPTGHQALNALGDFAAELVLEFNRYGQQIDGIEVWSRPNAQATRISPIQLVLMVDSVAASLCRFVVGAQLTEPVLPIAGSLDIGGQSDWESYSKELRASRLPHVVSCQLSLEEVPARTASDALGTFLAATSGPIEVVCGADASGEQLATIYEWLGSQEQCLSLATGATGEMLAGRGEIPASAYIPIGSALFTKEGQPGPAAEQIKADLER